MVSFIQFLLEYLDFNKGKDNDYPLSNKVIFTTKDGRANYKLQGQTHAEYSHAIKHYIEFNPGYVMACGAEIKGMLDKAHNEGNLDYLELYDYKTGRITKGFDQVFAKAKTLDYVNMLDYINDKNIEKSGFTKLELDIKRVGDRLRKLYDEEIQKRLNDAISLDGMSIEKINKTISTPCVISFSTKNKEEYILDLTSGVLIIKQNDAVSTCYIPNKNEKGMAMLKSFVNKRPYLKYVNKNMEKVFLELLR